MVVHVGRMSGGRGPRDAIQVAIAKGRHDRVSMLLRECAIVEPPARRNGCCCGSVHECGRTRPNERSGITIDERYSQLKKRSE